jgi:hypothetical protein
MTSRGEVLSWFHQLSSLDSKEQLSYSGAMTSSKVLDPNCSIARSLGVLGERWTFLILREAMDGVLPRSVRLGPLARRRRQIVRDVKPNRSQAAPEVRATFCVGARRG